MFKKNIYLAYSLCAATCASTLFFYSCGKAEKVSQEDFMQEALDKIAQSPNSLQAKFTATCDPQNNKKIAFTISNEEVFMMKCNMNEFDFFASSISPKVLNQTRFEINGAESLVAKVAFPKTFPKHGVALAVLCVGDGKTFRDIQLVHCPT